MSIKLAPAKPDDRYARLYFAFEKVSDAVVRAKAKAEEEADDQTGWIEFWADDAKACKEPLRRIAGRLYVLGERRDKRSKDLTDEKALEELNEFNRLLIDGLALRTKAWRLFDSEGNAVEAPVTFENAKEVYADEDHNLREVIQEFLRDRVNFPLRANAVS